MWYDKGLNNTTGIWSCLSAELEVHLVGFPGGTVVKNPPATTGDMGSSPGQEDPTCHGATKAVWHNY